MALPLARCGLSEIRCIQRGTHVVRGMAQSERALARCGLIEIRCIRRGTHLVRGVAQNGLASGSMWPD